jgi:hypothetical protein
VTVQITSPDDAASFEAGAVVHLAADVSNGAEPAWSAGQWSTAGNDLDVTDLPVGTWDLTAAVGTASDVVAITITQPMPRDYAGELAMSIDLSSDEYGDYTFACTHISLDFTIDPEGTLGGEGQCKSPLETYVFAMEGTVVDEVVSGFMITDATPDDPLPFEGTRTGADVSCTFDKTWVNEAGDGSFRLYGSFAASEVE